MTARCQVGIELDQLGHRRVVKPDFDRADWMKIIMTNTRVYTTCPKQVAAVDIALMMATV
jgi:hypothetical protein